MDSSSSNFDCLIFGNSLSLFMNFFFIWNAWLLIVLGFSLTQIWMTLCTLPRSDLPKLSGKILMVRNLFLFYQISLLFRFLKKKKNEIVNLLFLILSSDYLVEKCGFPESEASNLRYELFKTYGSSLAGLRVIHLSFWLPPHKKAEKYSNLFCLYLGQFALATI